MVSIICFPFPLNVFLIHSAPIKLEDSQASKTPSANSEVPSGGTVSGPCAKCQTSQRRSDTQSVSNSDTTSRLEDDLMNFVQAAINKDKIGDSCGGDSSFDPFDSLLPANQGETPSANQNTPLLITRNETTPTNQNLTLSTNQSVLLASRPNLNQATNSETTS